MEEKRGNGRGKTCYDHCRACLRQRGGDGGGGVGEACMDALGDKCCRTRSPQKQGLCFFVLGEEGRRLGAAGPSLSPSAFPSLQHLPPSSRSMIPGQRQQHRERRPREGHAGVGRAVREATDQAYWVFDLDRLGRQAQCVGAETTS